MTTEMATEMEEFVPSCRHGEMDWDDERDEYRCVACDWDDHLEDVAEQRRDDRRMGYR